MKLKVGLLVAWVIPQVFLFFLNLWVLVYITGHEEELKALGLAGQWILIWLFLTASWIIGTVRILRWYKQGKFHEDRQE
ncbi:hypothetical protein DNH61_02660 [Paenibacillus sambharensis]|uniref:Uncharacterized protein n=1 Tax=Paenibacillus sambharensis TaxID=1803190 RepID=A0A2W1LDW8_9BACL|nr:hypothetical protein [Paenibacillus sambharensis]PZD97276.1 hypothetical protein DNH61_02660 [Paenibacillus sambharensis]